MRLFGKIFHFFLLALLLTSCSTYAPRPLNSADLMNALSQEKNKISQQATLLNHSRIPPIRIDFTKPLNAKELAVMAVLISPDLQAIRSKEGVAQAQVFNAGLLPDPQFAYTYARPLQSIAGLTNLYTYGINWDIGALVTTQTNLKVVKAVAQQTRYDVAWQEWLVANQTELLASRIYFIKQQLRVARNATQSAKQILDITESNLKKHNTTIDEFGLRQATYLDFLDQVTSLERLLKRTILQLNQILGLRPSENIALNVKPIILPRLNAEELFTEAQVYRLDLLALQAGYASQEAKFFQAILGQFPHITMGIVKGRDNTNIHSLGGGINFDIPLFNRNRGAIAIAKTTREQLYLEYIARLNQTRSDIAILVADLEIISREEKILNKQVPQMEKAERLMRKGLNNGNITLITYESVLTSLLTNQLRLLTLRQNITEQMIALQIAVGRYQ